MDWYCKKKGISELTQKYLEGPAYETVKVFHPGIVHLQFQMEECHKLLTDQVDDAILRYNVNKPLPLGGDPGRAALSISKENTGSDVVGMENEESDGDGLVNGGVGYGEVIVMI
ncbi:hypothetical protein Tco_0916825 [Tanacetum coccineum]